MPELPLERAPRGEEKRQLRESVWSHYFREALPPDWQVLSVTDGPTKPIIVVGGKPPQTRDVTIVVVKIGNGGRPYDLTLVPVEWPSEDIPSGDTLGVYSLDAQGARIFLCEQALPQDLRRYLIKHYHLAQPPWLHDRLSKRVSNSSLAP